MSHTLVAAPHAVFSVLDDAYRDIAVADDVVAGRFTIAGRTVSLGASPDWIVDPYPDDKEGRVEWVKFYYGLDLAHAYAVTKDARYVDAWTRLVTSFVAQVPAAADDTEVMARRIQNWIYAWNRFQTEGGHAGLPEDLAPAVVEYLWAEVQHVRANLTRERNHRTLELYALLVAALAFPELDGGHALRDFALEQLHLNLLADVRPDGVHREGSTHYHCIVLRSFLGAMRNAQLAGVTLPESYAERVTRAAEFAMHCHRPDGVIPACSDSDSESYRDVLRQAGQLLDRLDFTWAATMGAEGQAPCQRFASFPDGGYYTQRGGWGTDRPFADETFSIFDCGPIGDGGHGHYDALSVEVAAGGRPLLVDPGRFTYAETPPNWRHWFKGTAAHNTVLVGGLDQTPYQRRKPRGPVATCRLLARASAPTLDLLVGETTSPCYDAVHARAVLFVAGEYWLVTDYLESQDPHDYQVRWHLSPEAGEGVTVRTQGPAQVEARGVTLTFAPAGTVQLEAGWTAPLYGVKHPAPVAVVSTRATSTVLVTSIDPREAASRHATHDVRLVTPGNGRGDLTRVDVHGVGAAGGGVDTLVWASACQPIAMGGFVGTARAVWARRDAYGRVVAVAAADVLEGTWSGAGIARVVGDGAAGLWLTWADGQAEPTVARSAV